MEPRRLLSGNPPPIDVGIVYLEQDQGSDQRGDLFQLTFHGGAPGTQLRRVVIDGDQNSPGFGVGDLFFDIQPGGLGAGEHFPFQVISHAGVDAVRARVEDGSTRLVLDFTGFHAGETVVFEIDVDEVEQFDPAISDLKLVNEGFDTITSGVEFQGTHFVAEFTAPHFFDASAQTTFRNRYDELLLASGLSLPEDNAGGMGNRSAGAFIPHLEQRARPASIQGYVYHDQNNDGQRAPHEGGIAGVEIRIVPLDTVVPQDIVTVVTDARGAYEASPLAPGTYRLVQANQPEGYLDGIDTLGTVAGRPSGRAGQDQFDQVVLGGGERGLEFNFGELLPIQLSGHVRLTTPEGDCSGPADLNRRVPHALVQLLDAEGRLLQETRTDLQGRYEFTQLRPGVYSLRELTPEGLIDGAAHVGHVAGAPRGSVTAAGAISDISVSSGETGLGYDFCEHEPAALAGYVYHDRDHDGRRAAGEEGIAGVLLTLRDDRGEIVATQRTVADGRYEFTHLPAGRYHVEQAQPAGWMDGLDSAGTIGGATAGQAQNPGDRLEAIRLKWGDQGQDYNFGEFLPVTIRGRVHETTADGDCGADPQAQPAIAGAIVELLNREGHVLARTQSDTRGEYQFSGLAPGEYQLRELTPDGYFDAGAQLGTVDGQRLGSVDDLGVVRGLRLLSGQTAADYHFCEHVPAELSGTVFHDRNHDGLRQAGETGIGGARVTLYSEHGARIETQTTAPDGSYRFTHLRAGAYRVEQTQPQGWIDGLDRAGHVDGAATGVASNPGDSIDQVRLRWGSRGSDFNFGELLPASIRGRVQESRVEGDCRQPGGASPPPVAGAIVELWSGRGELLAKTVTDAQGNYAFSQLLPGEYQLRELTPEGYIDGGAHRGYVNGRPVGLVGEEGTIRQIRLLSGDQAQDFDFCEHVPSSLGGHVYHDQNQNGRRDAGELPIPGATLQLFDAGGQLVAETRSDAHGAYRFAGLRAGSYAIHQLQPAGWLDGIDSAGGTDDAALGVAENPGDRIRDILLSWHVDAGDFNFGELLPGSIAGRVHSDIVRDCRFDPAKGEVGLPGVRIELYRNDGSLVATTLTDSQGGYRFSQLAPGNYTLRQRQPQTHFDGGQSAGSHGGDASAENQIGQIRVGSGEQLVDYNFCEVPPATISGYVFQDGDVIRLHPDETLPDRIADIRNGERTQDDKPLSSVTLELRDGIRGTEIDGHSLTLPGSYTDGKVIVVTDANGFYQFTGLLAGQYAVYQHQPAGYLDGVDTPGSLSGFVFNPGEPVNQVVWQTLEVDPQNDAIVRIGLPPGAASADNNFSEVRVDQVPRPPQIPPPQVPRTPVPPARSPQVAPHTPSSPNIPGLGGYRVQPVGGSATTMKLRTWHLSVIDGGQPRGTGLHPGQDPSLWLAAGTPWKERTLDQGLWIVPQPRGTDGEPLAAPAQPPRVFGLPGAIPVIGDFNGDGRDEIGIYVGGEWFIDMNGNGLWDREDLWAQLGTSFDLPVTGDWDGDGKCDIGTFGRQWAGDTHAVANDPGLPDQQNHTWGALKNIPPRMADAARRPRLMQPGAGTGVRADVIDHVFRFGRPDDRPVTGDWNGDGIATIGVFRDGVWLLDVDGNGRWSAADLQEDFGAPGDIPLVGDFNGDGIDDLAIFRHGLLIIDSNGNRRLDPGDERVPLGQPGDQPVVGDLDGDGKDEVILYRPQNAPAQLREARKAG